MKQPDKIILAPKNGHTKQITLFVHPELVQVLKTAAKVRNVPVSRLYRAAIECYSETVL